MFDFPLLAIGRKSYNSKQVTWCLISISGSIRFFPYLPTSKLEGRTWKKGLKVQALYTLVTLQVQNLIFCSHLLNLITLICMKVEWFQIVVTIPGTGTWQNANNLWSEVVTVQIWQLLIVQPPTVHMIFVIENVRIYSLILQKKLMNIVSKSWLSCSDTSGIRFVTFALSFLPVPEKETRPSQSSQHISIQNSPWPTTFLQNFLDWEKVNSRNTFRQKTFTCVQREPGTSRLHSLSTWTTLSIDLSFSSTKKLQQLPYKLQNSSPKRDS